MKRLIPDEQPAIEATLRELVDREGCHLVLTTGGTGPAERDVTPEATLAVADKVMPGFGEQMRQVGLRFVPTAILSRQAGVIRKRALILNLPGQPKAIRETLEGVAKVVEKHNLFVISDEIYDRLVYGTEHTCFATLPGMRERTILLGGFSKAYAMTGWRLAYTCARNELTEAMMKVHQYVMMSAPTPAQFAAIEALRNGEEDVRGMVAEYDRRRQLVVGRLEAMGLQCPAPRGAFYAFPQIGSSGMNDETFAERLLMEERVAVIPGSAFGEAGAGHVRICYAQRYEVLEEAMDRIERFVGRQRPAAK